MPVDLADLALLVLLADVEDAVALVAQVVSVVLAASKIRLPIIPLKTQSKENLLSAIGDFLFTIGISFCGEKMKSVTLHYQNESEKRKCRTIKKKKIMKTTMKLMLTGILFSLSMTCLASGHPVVAVHHKPHHAKEICCKHSNHKFNPKHCPTCLKELKKMEKERHRREMDRIKDMKRHQKDMKKDKGHSGHIVPGRR